VERVGNIVSSLIANLMVLHRDSKPYQRLAIPMERRKLTRYDRRGFRHLPQVVAAMAEAGMVIVAPAYIKQRRTGIEATGSLLEALHKATMKLSDIGRAEGEETIWLTARTGRDDIGRKLPAEQIDYEDTAATAAMRMEMEELNRFLSAQRIELGGEPQATFRLTRRFTLRCPSDPLAFNLHGRVYGGFWQSLPKRQRDSLRINGEPIADLDFVSMFPRLAYIAAGAEPPPGDLYAIPGLEEHRAGVKAGFAALLSTSSEMSRLPSEVKEALPNGWTAAKFKDAVSAKHPALVPFFGRDFAMDLMFTESCILMATLCDMMRQGFPALPMHDGLMVMASHEAAARQAMARASMKIVGFGLPVTKKELEGAD
jgi:hypothetical protein